MQPSDSMAAYFAEVVGTRLLRADEEVSLGRRVRAGDAAARWELASANLLLVVKIARSYRCGSISLDDAIGEGHVGLLRAVDRFDPERGFRFSTYATWWIRQAIGKAIQSARSCAHVPSHQFTKVRKLEHERSQLAARLSREPSDHELALSIGEPLAKVRQMTRNALALRRAVAGAATLENAKEPPIPDESLADPIANLSLEEERDELEARLSRLDPRSRAMIRLRFGLDDGKMRRLSDIGVRFHLTRERVRQILSDALARIGIQTPLRMISGQVRCADRDDQSIRHEA